MASDNLKDAITSEDILGKDVIDRTGAFLGVTDKLYLSTKNMKVIGISVDKGFLRKGFVIGSDYIGNITEHAVFLSIEPVFRLKGMTVFDCDGAKIGKVVSLKLENDANSIDELYVRTARLGGEQLTIPAECLERIESNVLLSITAQRLRDMQPKAKAK